MNKVDGHEQTNEHFRLLVDSVSDYAIVLLDVEGRVRSWNAGAERLKGYLASEITGRSFSEFYPPDDRANRKPERLLEMAARDGRVEDESWRVRKDGSRFWANVVITALRDPEGRLVGYAKVTRDLTERRRAEDMLRRSEERLRALIDSARDYAILMLDVEGRVASWNAVAERINAFRQDEIVGQHVSRLYPPEAVAAKKPERELEIAAEAGRFEEEEWRIRKDGTKFWASVVITAMRDAGGHLIGYATVTRDLTERRAADEAIRLRDLRLRTMVESVKDYAIFMLDPDGRVATWNPGAERIKGYQPAEIIGQHFSKFYPPSDIAAGKPAMELRVASAEGRYEDEGWRLRKDGSKFWASVVITALHDQSGQLMGFAKVTRDLTERRRSEEDRIERARAEAAVKLRDEFLAVASHELRTPLSTLRLQADGLHRAVARPDADVPHDRVVERLELIRRQIGRLELLVTELLDVSRISAGRLEIEREPLDLSTVVREMAEHLADPLQAAGCELRASYDTGVCIHGDRMRLEQAVTNLIINAMKYGHHAPIDVEVRARDGVGCVIVRDRGIGVELEQQQRIFERFERAADAKHFAGLGLGLWITRQIVQAHAGTVRVESRPGEGATFVIEIPLSRG